MHYDEGEKEKKCFLPSDGFIFISKSLFSVCKPFKYFYEIFFIWSVLHLQRINKNTVKYLIKYIKWVFFAQILADL